MKDGAVLCDVAPSVRRPPAKVASSVPAPVVLLIVITCPTLIVAENEILTFADFFRLDAEVERA